MQIETERSELEICEMDDVIYIVPSCIFLAVNEWTEDDENHACFFFFFLAQKVTFFSNLKIKKGSYFAIFLKADISNNDLVNLFSGKKFNARSEYFKIR